MVVRGSNRKTRRHGTAAEPTRRTVQNEGVRKCVRFCASACIAVRPTPLAVVEIITRERLPESRNVYTDDRIISAHHMFIKIKSRPWTNLSYALTGRGLSARSGWQKHPQEPNFVAISLSSRHPLSIPETVRTWRKTKKKRGWRGAVDHLRTGMSLHNLENPVIVRATMQSPPSSLQRITQ